MPLWNVYCSEGTYSSEDKRGFAEAVTDAYVTQMPRFLCGGRVPRAAQGFAVHRRRAA
jgi:putative oxalocrotonate tautomerase-like protein